VGVPSGCVFCVERRGGYGAPELPRQRVLLRALLFGELVQTWFVDGGGGRGERKVEISISRGFLPKKKAPSFAQKK
jgi:hypothetical protein